ncbi:hypothetical protein FGG08_001091 [Glutinoglossum americanum]|uniref:BHLH domain-containing protein n=1 Tax=Glutinoglossum americanum TaxID=1670608 RepID=A0A9P8I925_9PEZI|nr:hypothetical protein FGG08_001091 [Glutinoglossum americanum]
MASSRSPVYQLPFGYFSSENIEPLSSFPYPSPPAPTGVPLLDDNESSMLGDFFEKVSGPSFDTSEYFFDKALPPSGDEPYLFGWSEELPPSFNGPATSLSQPPMTSQSYLGLSNTGPLAMEGLPTTSTEVLSVASAFSRNGQPHQNEHANDLSDDSLFPTREVANILMEVNNTPSSGQRSVGSFSTPNTIQSEHQRTSSNPMTRRLQPNHLIGGYYSALNFPQQRTRTPIESSEGLSSKTKIDIRWGSDGNFLGNGYLPPPEEVSMEEKEKEMMKRMECLVSSKSSSTNNSSPPSPTDSRKQVIGEVSRGALDSSSHDEPVDDQGDSRPGRKRKCTNDDVGGEEDGDLPNLKAKKGGRRKNSSSDSSFKRRKSQSGSQKAIRENLTEEQKRSNHIMSEQKRRNLIKQGFDDLCELVPDLKGGGYSKSAVLLQSADWLENLLKGNDLLRNILASLEGRT